MSPDERRQAIIAATRPLLVARGGQFTIKEVAEAAGIAEGTIFRVFASKQDLMHAVVADILDTASLCRRIEALPDVPDPVNQDNYDFYLQRVDNLIAGGAPLFPGSCVEPNALHMLCTGDWKYTRYYDDVGTGQPDQYEMYHLPSDPTEIKNLVDFKTGALRPGVSVPGFSQAQLQAQLELLRGQLADQENKVLLTA